MRDSVEPRFIPDVVNGVQVPKTSTQEVEIGIGNQTEVIINDFEYSYDVLADPRKVVVTEVHKISEYHWKLTFYNLHSDSIDITVKAILVPKRID
ncbi:hypothetical protein [Bacillus cereus group sp. BfR-BA-01319]|uniref:hypothetical protein n=1 Tax=Bacillus cereus group sp. BfR-BA-01319 TaxID=2920296 RepID=UPI001F5631C2|nr:hypothetical protein [Bacillus cereus group sp. BfR-BA-01319]